MKGIQNTIQNIGDLDNMKKNSIPQLQKENEEMGVTKDIITIV